MKVSYFCVFDTWREYKKKNQSSEEEIHKKNPNTQNRLKIHILNIFNFIFETRNFSFTFFWLNLINKRFSKLKKKNIFVYKISKIDEFLECVKR